MLTSTFIIAAAIIIGFILAALIIWDKKNTHDSYSDDYSLDSEGHPGPEYIDTFKNIIEKAWNMYDADPKSNDFIEIHSGGDGCQIIAENDDDDGSRGSSYGY